MDYVFGLAKNSRLKKMIVKQAEQARRAYLCTGDASRVFNELHYRTQKTWSRRRRVVAKAEHLAKGANPRFVVTIREVALVDTDLARAQAGTLRTKLFKIGALVKVSVRRIYVRLSSAFPRQALLALALSRLTAPTVLT